MNVGKVHLVEFRNVVLVGSKSLVQGHTHVVVSGGGQELNNGQLTAETDISQTNSPSTRADLDTNTVSTKHVDKDLHDLETESTSVLGGTTPLVGSLVGAGVQKFIDEVSGGRVQFNTVKASLFGEFSLLSELGQNDPWVGNGSRSDVGDATDFSELTME